MIERRKRREKRAEILPALATAVDLAFLPALAIAITPALQAAPRRNRVFLPVLGVLLLANLGVRLDAQGVLPGLGAIALRVTLDLFAVLIALIGGRVVPAFTGNALAARGEAEPLRTFSVRDRLAIGALVLMLLADLQGFTRAAGAVALAPALLNGWRLHGWGGSRTLREPILWVLHLGYLWLALGLAWKGLVDLSALLPPAGALHGLAIGAVGTMTLAIMSRATLGHTGRPLHASPLVVASYVLVGTAAVARLAAPLAPAQAIALLVTSGAFWSLAFAASSSASGPRWSGLAPTGARAEPARSECGQRESADPRRGAPVVLSRLAAPFLDWPAGAWALLAAAMLWSAGARAALWFHLALAR
jgi:uncharacterized protein involved in response to NO